ncbi:hypothetical protein CK203_077406 [Vitis vinifera]|uniref:Uncharacterized protein n=1 Tax=Vitis vinifera TaxID=29760 RepID=A0A438D276_VITVI|nr:hypothetical protein CK203_077406 [Vitis vinifera]
MFDVTFKTWVGYLQLRVTSRSESDYEARTRQGEQKRRWHRSIHRRLGLKMDDSLLTLGEPPRKGASSYLSYLYLPHLIIIVA